MDDGAYAEAIAGYHASYEISRNPALLYNIGSAYERLGDFPRALAYLEQFSAVASAGLKARVPALGDLIASLRSRLARVTVGCNVAGARVLVRGSWRATTPRALDISVLPGLARVDVVADGYQRFSREVLLEPGKETRLDAVLLSSAAFTSAREAPPEPRRNADGGLETKWWFWTGLGVVVAAGATVGIVLATTHHSDGAEATAHAAAPLLSW
jgi:tetratricopeptide (TPR) repeat protein